MTHIDKDIKRERPSILKLKYKHKTPGFHIKLDTFKL